jgi:glycosyltransferase involved in cell wall biosynthesis
MKSKLITVVPVYNGEQFILQVLESIARQTLKPDLVVVLDNRSTDKTEELVRNFKTIPVVWRQNEKNLGWIGNFNRALDDYAEQTDYLHLICADDAILPEYYERLIKALEDCDGVGLAYCLDERIDEQNKTLSFSGKITGVVEVEPLKSFLKRKAEVANQAASGSLMKTAYRKVHCKFRPDFASFADMVFWAEWSVQCKKIVCVHLPLVQFRWHHSNNSANYVPQLQALVLDEWRGMQLVEQLRDSSPGFVRRFKLKGIFAVRSGIKAKRFREQKNASYASQIVQASREITGPLAWWMAQVVVEVRDIYVYRLLGRPKHPKNVYS